ncbi:kinase-like protein, partial [Periconia macrospinosa]
MSRIPDLVRDSELQTEFRGAATIHSFLGIDDTGARFWRKEQWEWDLSLGRGGFGNVNLQRCVVGSINRENGLRAVKVIEKSVGPSQSLNYNRELEAIAKFSHDRYRRWFVKSYGWFQDPHSIFMTMEYCQYGDLQRFLRGQGRISTEEVQQLAFQMAEGLDQMHQNDFAHRDLKPGNILIKSMPPDQKWWIVLADFGISKRADENNGAISTIKGTSAFMAPELLGILEDQKPRIMADFKAADMWALGEMLFLMLTGESTFQDPMDLMRYCFGQRVFPSHRLPSTVTDHGHEIVGGLMAIAPHSRFTTTQCIQHPWVASV